MPALHEFPERHQWTAAVEAAGALQPGRGGVACVQLEDLGAAGAPVEPGLVAAVARRLALVHGGAAGLARGEGARFYFLVKDDDAWAAIVANVAEAATAAGFGLEQLGLGVGLGRRDSRQHSVADVARLATRAAGEACASGAGFATCTLHQERREARAVAVRRAVQQALHGDLDGMHLIYQPQVDAHTGELVGAEALLRFRCQDPEDVSAIEVLEAAEALGELARIDRWALGLAGEFQRQLRDAGVRSVPVSVNLRAATVAAPDFVEFVRATLTTFDVPPGSLELELSASEVQANPSAVAPAAHALRRLGVGLVLDGFGAARTGLADLRRLPITGIKLDGRVVRELEGDAERRRTIQGLVHLARAFGLGTTAVGVETVAQADLLRSAGCGAFQGFLYHVPMGGQALIDAHGRPAGRPERSATRAA